MQKSRLIGILGIWCAITSYAQNETAWGYSGAGAPAKWGSLSLNYALCGNGQKQSPINITQTTASNDNRLQVSYSSAPLIIEDNGLTTLKIGSQTLVVNDGHTIQLNFPGVGNRENIQFNGDTYDLVQFHFHTPAENHVQGQVYPAEIHFVNQSADGKIAVIGVFIKEGAKNLSLQQILDNLPKNSGKAYEVPNMQINPATLLPMNKSYYNFQGSLTTPPCNEGLQWIVMVEPIEASAGQIAKLRQAVGENNVRPIQALNNRTVYKVDVK